MATKAPKSMKTEDTQPAEVEYQGAQNEDGSAQEARASGFAPFVPKLKKILTLPLLKLKIGEPVYVQFTGEMFLGKEIHEDDPSKRKAPPVMANVVNLKTGELVQIMLGTTLQGILNEEYPDHSYVKKGFSIELCEQKRGRSGGNYNVYKVAEIEV